MAMERSRLADRRAVVVQLALLLAAPAMLLLAAAIICPAGDCRPGRFDLAGMELAARGHAPSADLFFRLVTWGGSILFLGPLALAHCALMWQRLHSRQVFFLPGALAGAALIAYGVKILVARERPDVAALVDMPADASFPSAHTLQVSALVMAWLLAPGADGGRARSAAWLVGMLAVALVAWSRLHLQVHYPTDILLAFAAGTVWVLTLRQLTFWSLKP